MRVLKFMVVLIKHTIEYIYRVCEGSSLIYTKFAHERLCILLETLLSVQLCVCACPAQRSFPAELHVK